MRGSSVWVVVVAAGMAGCGGGGKPAAAAPGGGGGGAPQAMPVQVTVAAPVNVPETSTFVASIQSRDSMVISPLVAGIIRAILVKSGDQVPAGAPLIEIDNSLQQATVENLENNRTALLSTLEYDKQQLDRFQALYNEKIGTLQDYQAAQSAYNTVKAQVDSDNAQIKQQQTVLSYFKVTAPRAGIVGDIPVKVGDQVTTATQLTTIDAPGGLEVYVQVPIEQDRRLRVGLPLLVEDGQGNPLAQTTIRFISPQVDTQTQSILVKADVSAARQRLRAQQYVQAVITWGTHSAFEVPVLSVSQINGRDFTYLASPRGAGFYANQVPITVGSIVGNNYEVTGGLQAGDKVIVSTSQILQPGMPVMPMPAGGRGRGGR
ncbi:MAG TPA: efflux RND transporter periplasmic adaptor subunit [Terriglobales bacterium]|nr:efflux RND transporter periplasmic adaptor subunit [Terriglobales bacterium]